MNPTATPQPGDTPRTDAEVNRKCEGEERGLAPHLIYTSFARTLERELADAKAALVIGQHNCDAVYDDLREERDRARAELATWRGILLESLSWLETMQRQHNTDPKGPLCATIAKAREALK